MLSDTSVADDCVENTVAKEEISKNEQFLRYM